MENIIIRTGKKTDISTVYNLVIELAVYEKEPDAVTATLEDYYNDFEEGIFKTLVAEIDGKVVGMMLYYMVYSTWKGKMVYLEDFVINEQYRRHGVGQLLYDKLLIESKKMKARLVKWQVIDWNEPAINFYKKNNAIIETEWYNVKKFI
ncbi:MAG: ribosomal protein S18 acetylase RimI-like enzyme [Maribacter sp.]|jgi:ribosomal protein S18 acetylase RimI-like enzyme